MAFAGLWERWNEPEAGRLTGMRQGMREMLGKLRYFRMVYAFSV